MKILYYHAVRGNLFNDVFAETITGLELNGVTCRLCPPEIYWEEVKNFDVIIFDSPMQWILKELHYLPVIKDKRIYNLKLGIFTTDFWVDCWQTKMKEWLQNNQIKDFIIFRHSSGMQLHNTKQYKLLSAARDEKIKISKKPNNFLPLNEPCIDFEHAILSPFTIDKDRMILGDKIQKKFDICFGAHLCSWYPMREIIQNAAINSGKFSYINPTHQRGGLILNKKREPLTPYYKSISMSWLTLATTGLANISTRKHYEITGLGTTCLGNHTGLEDHGIVKENTIVIPDSASKDDIVDIISLALKDKDKLQRISNIVKEQIRNEYDYRKVTKKLVTDLEVLYENK